MMSTTSAKDESRLRTLDDVMEFLGIKRTKLYELIDDGKLVAVKLGRRSTRITQESLDAYSEDVRKNARIMPGKQR